MGRITRSGYCKRDKSKVEGKKPYGRNKSQERRERKGTEGYKHRLPERSCLIRPLLLDVLTGRKSLNQVISGSGLPLAAQSMVAVRERSTTFSCGPMSMVGKPEGSWSSGKIRNRSKTELDITHISSLVAQSSGSQPFFVMYSRTPIRLAEVPLHLSDFS